MKKIFLATLIIMLGILAPSCAKFLMENPTTSLSEGTAYADEETLEAQIYGCYASFHADGLWKGTMAEYFHTSSGLLIWKGGRATDEWLDGLKLGKYSTSTFGNYNIWRDIFTGINRCNKLLDNLPGSPVDAAFKTEIEAEAKFLRAVLYFTAVRIWGDVPLYTKSPTLIEETSSPRTRFDLVYKQVLDDLTFAEENMRDAARSEAVAPGKGRPVKMAATAFKASVYMTIGSLLSAPADDNFWDASDAPDFTPCDGIKDSKDAYLLAYQAACKVIDSGQYKLVDDYRTLFRWSEEGDWSLPERIMCLESSPKTGVNYNSVRMLPLFPEGTSDYTVDNMNNYGRVRPSRWLVENFIKYSGGTYGDGNLNKNLYAITADPRFDVTFYHDYKRLDTGERMLTYPDNSAVGTNNTHTSLPYYRKYADPTYNVDNGRADFYLMRFAEMYLIAAESAAALCECIGDEWCDIAIRNVNVIRTRARNSVDKGQALAPLNYFTEDFEDSVENLRDAIWWERSVEMSGEGHERFDTHRFGATWLANKVAIPENKFFEADMHMRYYQYTYYSTFPTTPAELRKSLLNAIPLNEMTYNSAISQNKYYWQ